MNKTIILLATLALAGCNRGGFSKYEHKADPKAVAAEQARAKAMKRATGPLTTAYYSASMTHTKDGVVIPDKAARARRADIAGMAQLPPAQGSRTTNAEADAAARPSAAALKTRPPYVPMERAAAATDPAENAAIIARIQAARDQGMRAAAKKDEIRNAQMRSAARPKDLRGEVRPTRARTKATGADVTLPAPSGR